MNKNLTVTVVNIYTKVSKCSCEVSSRTPVSAIVNSLSWDCFKQDSRLSKRATFMSSGLSDSVRSDLKPQRGNQADDGRKARFRLLSSHLGDYSKPTTTICSRD
jgi:hypothetical protein